MTGEQTGDERESPNSVPREHKGHSIETSQITKTKMPEGKQTFDETFTAMDAIYSYDHGISGMVHLVSASLMDTAV